MDLIDIYQLAAYYLLIPKYGFLRFISEKHQSQDHPLTQLSSLFPS